MKIGLFLEGDSSEFPKQAEEWRKETGAMVLPILTARSMIEPACAAGPRSVDQLSVFGHGTTSALGKPGRFGVDVRPVRQTRPGILSPADFAEAWAPALKQGALVSLAACLCGRSQHWYLQGRFGKAAATYATPWGQESYENGGASSLALSLVRAFHAEGVSVHVRAHCAAGHCTYQALLRDFTPRLSLGLSLFRMVLGPAAPWSIRLRNLWQERVKGLTAERWLLGDDSVVAELKRMDW